MVPSRGPHPAYNAVPMRTVGAAMMPLADRLLIVLALLMPVAGTGSRFTTDAGDANTIISSRHVPSTPQWLTFYNTDLDPVRGQQNLSNLIYSPDLSQIDNASRDFGIDGMWSGPWGCEVNVSRVWGEPYCSGPTGLWKGTPWKSWGATASWEVGATWVVEQVKLRPHIRGIFLGDEPTLFGVSYADICALSLHLKRGLLAAGRRDVFIYFNDTPESQQLKRGLCPGLDFFSLDSYNDDPATEVAQVKHAYSKVKARLRAPNYLEPRGQGFFVVPGIFWSIHHGTDQQLAPPCNAPGGTVCIGPDHKVNGPHDHNCSWSLAGTHCLTSPVWLVGKMAAYWACMGQRGRHDYRNKSLALGR